MIEELTAIGKEVEANAAGPGNEEKARTEPGGKTAEPLTLLDLLFDKGLLPSYAFPTDLCSFVIQERADFGKVIERERPQLGKTQALSEYAPGRILVVNKQTYRVGGIFFDGLATASPAEGFFDGVRDRYIGCPRCSSRAAGRDSGRCKPTC